MANNALTWIGFYTEFADKLLAYRDKRAELIDIFKGVFSGLNMKFPKVEADESVIDLDPFTIYGFFNKGITDANRKRIITEIKKAFDVQADVPEDFLGIPTMNNQSATFFYFLRDGRGEHDIDNLWDVLDAALAYDKGPDDGNKDRLATAFDIAEQQHGVKWNLTMGLYWCRPERYISLDSRNRWFMEDEARFPKEIMDEFQRLQSVPKGSEYLHLCKLTSDTLANGEYEYKYKTIPEFSLEAWLVSEEVNKQNKEAAKAEALRKKQEEDSWWPPLEEYDPGIKKEDWIGYLTDNTLTDNMLTMLKRMKDIGGAATCTQLSEKYGEKMGFYLSNGSSAAERIANASGCPLMPRRDDGNKNRLWPVLFVGKDAPDSVSGSFIWKLRPELDAALDEVDLSRFPLYADEKAGEETPNDADVPDFMGSYDADGVPDNALSRRMVMEVFSSGDVLRIKEVISRIAESGDISDEAMQVTATARPLYESRIRWSVDKLYKDFGYIDKLEKGLYVINARGLEFCRKSGMIEDNDKIPAYDKGDFLHDVYMREADVQTLVSQLRRKKNVILQGAPGTGKTYAAKRLAYMMMGARDDSRIKIVQFHQNTAYDDFVCGYRPVEGGGYETRAGVFVQFCRKASADIDRDYFFIIDEINRANISKVFGELLMLIEKDHRGDKVTLSLTGENFGVPKNVFIIGMMNTADRGLALIDYALRRRFAFFEMKPALENLTFRAAVEEAGGKRLVALVDAVIELNDTIAADPALGRGFRIGHSYFCDDGSEEDAAQAIIRFEIAPLLEEYWFDDPARAESEIRRLEDAVRESDEQ